MFHRLQTDIECIADLDLPWQRLHGKTFLVMGATSFLAAYVIRVLLYRNHCHNAQCRIIGTTRSLSSAKKTIPDILADSAFRLLESDLLTPLTISDRLDYIVHAASPASIPAMEMDPVGTMCANAIGIHHALELARKNSSCQVLFFSSGAVYDTDFKAHDSMYRVPQQGHEFYLSGKRAAEAICQAYYKQHGIDIRILRIAHSYGPGISLDDSRSFAYFASCIARQQPIVLQTPGLAVRYFCYITDTISAFFISLFHGSPQIAYDIINIEGGIRIRDLAKLCSDLYPDRHVQLIIPPDTMPPESQPIKAPVQNAKALEALGWKPRVSLSEGFQRFLDYSIQQEQIEV